MHHRTRGNELRETSNVPEISQESLSTTVDWNWEVTMRNDVQYEFSTQYMLNNVSVQLQTWTIFAG